MYIPSVWRYGSGKRRVNNADNFSNWHYRQHFQHGAAAMFVFGLCINLCIAAIASAKRELAGKAGCYNGCMAAPLDCVVMALLCMLLRCYS